MPRTTTFAPNLAAFLDMLAASEIGPKLLAITDDGYNVIVGSTPDKPITFTDYAHHPLCREWVDLNHNGKYEPGESSDAAGRYQFMGRYWSHYKIQLSLPDFGPQSQDKWAVQLIKECKALDDILTGHFDKAVAKCSSRWASLPGAGYGQPEHTLAALEDAYERAGGTFA